MPVNSRRHKRRHNQSNPRNRPNDVDPPARVLDTTQSEENQDTSSNGGEPKASVRSDTAPHNLRTYEQTIADFTKVLAVATVVLAVATSLLWWETRRLASQAVSQSEDNQKLLDAATKSADAANRTATSTRAWLCSNGSQSIVGDDAVVNGQHVGQTAAVIIQVANTGSSPALNVRTSGGFKIVTKDSSDTKFDDSPNLAVSEKGVVGPGTSVGFGPFLISSDDINQIALGQKQFLVHMYLVYNDVFQNEAKHETSLTLNLKFGGFDNRNGLSIPRWSPFAFGADNKCS